MIADGEDHFLLYGRQSIDDSDVDAVAKVLRSDWLTTGPTVATFERAFAMRVQAREAAACANGTAALHLAAMALGLGPGDTVVVPSMTFVATANAARFVGAEVVFADVDPEAGLMMPEHAAAAIGGPEGQRAKAVFPVHLNGQCGDPAGLKALADRYGLSIVEDACHALGATYEANGRCYTVGAVAHADLAIFSFHPVKAITTGEGGMVTGKDPALMERVRRFRNHGLVRDSSRFEEHSLAFEKGRPNPWFYEMPEPGFNYRLSDLQCALGLSQLERLDHFIARRASCVARYRAELADLAPIVKPIQVPAGGDPAWHLFVVLIDFAAAGMTRGQLMRELRHQGIGTQVHYIPVHLQPYYRHRYGELSLPGAQAYYERCLSLPLFPDMTNEDVSRVVTTLRRTLKGAA
jgi:UDP-4-amino-4,6-dideoxy-N-acetyl-beta-L-altrosamine transaminase